MQNGPFWVIVNIHQQSEVPQLCCSKQARDREKEHPWHLCIGRVHMTAKSPAMAPAAHVKQTGTAPLAFAQPAAALRLVLIQFRIWASCHLPASWETSEKFLCMWVSISMCLCVFFLGALWAGVQGAARAAVLAAISLWQRLPPHQPNWQRETHVWLELQHLKPKCSLSV